MVDPPTYRAEPDPAFAARLERLLLQRLTAGSDEPRSIRRGAASDGPIDTHIHSDDEHGDLIMLETETRPPHQPPPSSGRGSPGRWLMAAAAVAVVALVGTLVVAAGDDEDKVDAADMTPTTAPAGDVPARDVMELEFESELEPGRYFIDPDDDPATSLVVTYEVAAEGWTKWSGTYKQVGNTQAAVNIITVDNLAVDACTDHRLADPPVGPSVDDLATALAALKPFEVTAPPTDVTLLGYEGKHLQLAIPAGFDVTTCTDGFLQSWTSPFGEFTGYGDPREPGRTEDFWILDVNGQRLVIETNQGPWSTPEVLAERDAIFDSIRIEP